MKLIITDGQDQTQKQVADVENRSSSRSTCSGSRRRSWRASPGVVEKAIDAKIPVIVLDRNVDFELVEHDHRDLGVDRFLHHSGRARRLLREIRSTSTCWTIRFSTSATCFWVWSWPSVMMSFTSG